MRQKARETMSTLDKSHDDAVQKDEWHDYMTHVVSDHDTVHGVLFVLSICH